MSYDKYNRDKEDLSYAENLVGSYIDEMNAYSQDYEWARRLYIVEYILRDGPETNLAWDIPGTYYNESDISARTYLVMLKDLNVKVYYSDFDLISCQTSFGALLGAFVTKQIVMPNGESYRFIEFLELDGSSRKNLKIRSITSSKYQPLSDFKCLNEAVSQTNSVKEIKEERQCDLFQEAEIAYNQRKYSEALSLYRKSKSCAENPDYVEDRIVELSTAERQQSLLAQAENAYEEGRYNEAISLYQTYLDLDGNNNSSNRDMIINKIATAKAEIAFEELLEKAEYYLSRAYYDQAAVAYQQALEIKPGNQNVINQLNTINQKQKAQQNARIKQEISTATSWVKSPSRQEDALITFMKYEDTGLLNGEQFYFMSILLDQYYKAAKKAFDISRRDRCVLAKRYAIKASQLGISNQAYNYLWNVHFNNRSKTCD
jgi:tetratricopeptide (TPR) repeat protein